ncbi:MAG: HAD family hydrolase [Wujia sp.]
MIKGIIFDFDYTLGDSTKGIVKCANYALNNLGLEERTEAEISKTIGLTLVDTFKTLTGRENDDEATLFRQYFVQKADEVMVNDTVLYPGVKEILSKLGEEGYQLGIVTTKFRYRIEGILEKFDATNLIDLIVGGDDVKVEKPSPEGLLWAIDRLGLDKAEVLYVGDSLVDARTAANAGVSFAAVLTGTTTEEDFEGYPHVYIGKALEDVYNYIRNSIIKG